jgi:endoglucanase
MKLNERRLLESILRLPTAPFREHWVQAAIERVARRHDLPVRRDRFGNLYVSYRKGRTEPVAFTAHMDHPGFEIVGAGGRARAAFLGGVAADNMSGAPVLCYPDGGRAASSAASATALPEPTRGRIARVTSVPVPGQRPELLLDIDFDAPVAVGDFGVFDVPACEIEPAFLRARALDNLLSCVLILAALASLKRRGVAADVVGVFTRAEEVGFVGAGGVLRSLHLGTERPLVVLETSKEMAGVRMGAGPVLRVGDRMTSFDPSMDLWLASRAAALAAAEPDFAYQRALMTGGACEASLYMLHGRQTGAIALALGNYHNMTPEGGIGAEYISVSDFDNALLLLEDLAVHPPESDILERRRGDLDAVFDRLGPRLLPPRRDA